MQDLVKLGDEFLSPVLAHYHKLQVKAAKGSVLLSTEDKKYLDCSSGIAVTNVGHCHPKVVKAVVDQAKTLMHICAGVAYYDKNVLLAKKLVELSPFEKASIFFTQSGTEAIEAAIKLVKYVSKKQGIIAFKGCFHGRTLGALSITYKQKFKQGYEPLIPNVAFWDYPYCFRCPYGLEQATCGEKCIGKLEENFRNLKSDVGAVFFEPILGEGGYVVPPYNFVKRLRELTKEHNVLLVFDEIQTGIGRTGTMFAAEHFDVVPDVMVLAKGLASGLPLGACIAKKELMDAWTTSAHGGTFSGNPVSCASALATIEVIEEESLLKHVYENGQYIIEKFKELAKHYSVIGDVRGSGFMIGVEFINLKTKEPDPEMVKHILTEGLKKQVVFISCGSDGQVIRFIPPLTTPVDQLDKMFDILVSCIKSYKQGEATKG